MNGRVTLLCNLCEGCVGIVKRLLQSSVACGRDE